MTPRVMDVARDGARRGLRAAIDRSLRNPRDRGRRFPLSRSSRLAPHVASWFAETQQDGGAEQLALLARAEGGLALGAAVVRMEHGLTDGDTDALRSAVAMAAEADLLAYAPGVYLNALLAVPGEPRARALALDDSGALDGFDWRVQLPLAGWLLAIGEAPRAARAVERSGLPAGAPERRWLERWIPEPPVVGGPGALAILDYRHGDPRFASANLGDWVQSISLLGHLLRQRGLELSSPDPELAAAAGRLREGIPADRLRDDVRGSLELAALDRDFSTRSVVRDGTWAFVFGWYMWPLIGSEFAFPFPAALRPIFVSFHVYDARLLTDEAVAYLVRKGPIGCRDWSTVRLLRERGVPAFFSGCLTTTVGTLFPPAEPDDDRPVAFVDTQPTASDVSAHEAVEQADPEILHRGFGANLLAAHDFLDRLRTRYRSIATSRLHSYLPSRSIGLPVDFRPHDPADPRFPGLVGLSDAEFDALRTRLGDRIAVVLAQLVEGRSEDEVRRTWAELWADELAEQPPA